MGSPKATRFDGYRAAAWLPGAHLQTIYPALWAPRARVQYRRERWDTPDGDFIDVDWAVAAGTQAVASEAPLMVLFHGLEGCSRSHYALALMHAAVARGWQGAVAHFRGCSGEPNLLPRAYHSGDSAEIDWILRRFAHCRPHSTRFAVGVSLGGNALAKWLGECGSRAEGIVRAAAAISAPQDLAAGAAALSSGFNRLYALNFLRTLKRKSLAKLDQHPGLFDRERMLAARDFFGFDDAVTAPMHGFASCHDYWARSSCKPFLASVAVPTLMLNARNDPFLPARHLAGQDEVSAEVRLEYPEHGGHVGFIGGPPPGRLGWLSQRVLGWFDEHLDHPIHHLQSLWTNA